MSKRLKFATVLVWVCSFILLSRNISIAQITVFTPTYEPSAPQVPNKIIVKFKSTTNAEMILGVSARIAESSYAGGLAGNGDAVVYRVEDVAAAIAAAKADPNVAYAGGVPKVFATKTVDDEYINKLWGLGAMKVGANTNGAWDLLGDVNDKTDDVKIAVVDTGVDVNHPDLAGKIADDDYVGCVAEGNGVVCNKTKPRADDAGHGTHVAGIIGAVTNNSKGIAGVGWGVKLMSVKVLDNDGGGGIDVALEGVKYAASRGAKVINMSWGQIENSLDSEIITMINNAMQSAWDSGALLVAAAGNCGAANNDNNEGCAYTTSNGKSYASNPKVYPAASPNVISVAATKTDGTLAPYSEYGSWVNIAAPGGYFNCPAGSDASCAAGGILSLWPASLITGQPPTPTPQKNYAYSYGTSMATPQVAGVAGLILAANSSLSNTQVKSTLESSADDSAPGITTQYAWGSADACRAVYSVLNNGATPPAGTCASGGGGGSGGAAVTPTPFPTGQVCPKKCNEFVTGYQGKGRGKGDYNCDGTVTAKDFNRLKKQFGTVPNRNRRRNANGVCADGGAKRDPNTFLVNLADFEKWRRNATSLKATSEADEIDEDDE
ncbi:S8 family serine peptidase [Candidatus Gottesmanbacteria bacterium]|nr:S8 family serine peptidase [Candidatus Gottesmanbacteria bacterium]